MAWIGAHFAMGVACGGAAAAAVCCVRRRGWKSIPLAMLAGGVWAVVPDLPHTIRQDFPGTALASWLGSREATRVLHANGNWFFFHSYLDSLNVGADWREIRYGLRGMALILMAYNVLAFGLFVQRDRLQRRVLKLLASLQAIRRPELIPISMSGASAAARSEYQPRDRRSNRRGDQRHKRRDPVIAVEVDPRRKASRALQDASLLDISVCGLALTTSNRVDPGATVYLRPTDAEVAENTHVQAVVLERLDLPADMHRLRCSVVGKQNPVSVFRKAA